MIHVITHSIIIHILTFPSHADLIQLLLTSFAPEAVPTNYCHFHYHHRHGFSAVLLLNSHDHIFYHTLVLLPSIFMLTGFQHRYFVMPISAYKNLFPNAVSYFTTMLTPKVLFHGISLTTLYMWVLRAQEYNFVVMDHLNKGKPTPKRPFCVRMPPAVQNVEAGYNTVRKAADNH